jgi:cytochrome c biogenesis protein CcmG/thiol:disulfide interchange protein DsbE
MRRAFIPIAIATGAGLSIVIKLTRIASVEGSVQELGPIKVGAAAPDGELTALSGEKQSIASMQGQAVLFLFGATWCGPCRAMLRPLRELADSTSSLRAIIVDVDVNEPIETVRAHYARRSTGLVRVTMDPSGRVAERFGVSAFPTLVIVNSQGVVQLIRVGALFELDTIRKVLEEAAHQ